jgi:pantothenate kinase
VIQLQHIHKTKVKKIAALLGLLGAIISRYAVPAFALTDSKVIAILNQFPLQQNSMISYVFRQIGWSILLGLYWIVSEVEYAVYHINDAIGSFFTSQGVVDLEKKVFPLAILLMGVLILYIGILSMIKPPNFSRIAGNLVVGVTIAIALPTLLSTAYSFTQQAITYLNSNSDGELQVMSDRILCDNITDVTLYDANGFQSTSLPYRNSFAKPDADASQITKINPVELVNPDDMEYPDVWRSGLTTDRDGNTVVTQLASGSIGFIDMPIMSQYYYRWKIDWLSILVTLGVTAFALIMSGIKIARLIFELAVNQTLTQVMALLDIITAQRVKKCIQMLIATLGTLFAMFFMMQIYILGMAYTTNVDNLALRLFLIVGLSWAVIDGPDLFEQVFGIDAGVHSAVRTMFGLRAASDIMKGAIGIAGGRGLLEAAKAGGVAGIARHAVGKAVGFAGGLGGIASGIRSGAADNRERIASVRNGFSSVGHEKDREEDGLSSEKSRVNTVAEGMTQKQNTVSQTSKSAAGTSQHSQAVSGKSVNSSHKTSEKILVSSDNKNPDTVNPEPEKPNEPIATVDAMTWGKHIRSGIARHIRETGAYQSAKRTYSLTRGSMLSHGDKKVRREERAAHLTKENPNLSHHEALKQAKREDRQAKIQNYLSKGDIKQ